MKETLSRVGLLIIGDEILQGRRIDKHFPWASKYFGELGVDIAWAIYSGDDLDLLCDQFETIRRRKEVCFSFGGIGATPDDLTRQAIAAANGLTVTRHPEAARLIEHQFGEQAYPNRILMADLPDGADLIPNGFNNIPGFFLDRTYCLPGFPEMSWPMLEWVVTTRYRTSGPSAIRYESIIVPGARESELIALLEKYQGRYPEVKLSSLPRFPQKDRWQVGLGVRGGTETVLRVADLIRAELTRNGYAIKQHQD